MYDFCAGNIQLRSKHVRGSLLALVTALSVALTALLPAAPARAESNEQDTFFFLTETLGYSGAAACGMMANIRAESGFYPGAYNGAGAYGLCQWMGGRQGNLHWWCGSNGYDSDSLHGQLAFLDHEMKTLYPGVYNYLMSVDNTAEGAYDAAYYMCYYYEAPANRSGQGARRGSMAQHTFWPRYEIYTRDIWLDTENGRMYHYKDGSYHMGWLELDGEIYYMDRDGILRAGIFTCDGKTYMADEDGARVTGWQTYGDGTYYFSPVDGTMQTGWIEVDGQQYLMGPNGKLEKFNAFMDKAGVTEEDIEQKAAEQAGQSEEAVNAPAAEPLPLPDKVSDAVENIQNAGTDSQNAAAVVASPGNDSAIDPDDYGSTDESGESTMDTSELQAGEEVQDPVSMESAEMEQPEEAVTFEDISENAEESTADTQ